MAPTIEERLAVLEAGVGAQQSEADTHWVLYCGVLVFLMQAGFAMLCAGSIRAKNAQNILLKNLMDAAVGALWFWATGFAFAYGSSGDGNWFIGNDLFFLSKGFEGKDGYTSWFFQWAFAATAATIVSGAVAERCSLIAYAGYSAWLTGFVYPVVVHWIWSSDGWLSAFIHDPIYNVGVVDFAGCGVVHMVGGAAAGIGAWILGPRIGRFGPNGAPIKGHSMPLVVLGTFLLWVGWYGFNPGSTLAISGAAEVAAKTAVTTTLAAATGGLTNLALHHKISGTFLVSEMCNGVLAGLVSITSACSVVEPWAAVVIGFIGAFAYTAGAKLLEKLEIDDAVNACPVHYFAGVWGLLAPGLFARPANMRAAYDNNSRSGLFYGGEGYMLACQVLAFVCITGWVAVCMIPFYILMDKMQLFRIPGDVEEMGLDESKHGGSAYNVAVETGAKDAKV
jgi:Amt family ammonium transporter